MTGRLVLRVIAGTCVLMTALLMLIVVSWLPAVVLSVRDYYRALNMPGTQSFHQEMANHFRQSIIMIGIFASSIVAWAGYVLIAIDPRPKRDQFVLLFGFAVIVTYLADASSFRSMNRDGILLFGAVPMTVGVLSLIGILVSRRAARVEPVIAPRASSPAAGAR